MSATFVSLDLSGRSFPAITEAQHRERGRQVGVFFKKRPIARVAPAAIVALPFLQRLKQLAAPVVLRAAGVLEAILAPGLHCLAEGVVVVIEPLVPHAGVLIERVMPADPADGGLHPRVLLA